jgi:hypothetical protein
VVSVALEVKEDKEAVEVNGVVALSNDTTMIWRCNKKPNRSNNLKKKLISKSGSHTLINNTNSSSSLTENIKLVDGVELCVVVLTLVQNNRRRDHNSTSSSISITSREEVVLVITTKIIEKLMCQEFGTLIDVKEAV